MTHTYSVSGITCNSCVTKVQQLLSKVDGVQNVNIQHNEASVTMQHHIQTKKLQDALKDYPKYTLAEQENHHAQHATVVEEENKTWFETYKPVLLIFIYITVITLLIEINNGFNTMHWMSNFMGAFFLVFSFFKMLDLKGFAGNYLSYDIIARRWTAWGYVYTFIELLLGIAFITGFNPLLTNIVTLIVMSVGIIGVLQSVFNKRKIQCACLGAVFNLPMSTITIIEDLLMIIMSAATLVLLLS